MTKISIVLPIFNERDNLEPLLLEIEEAVAPMARPFEIIAINDGSTDGSGRILEQMARKHPALKVIHFRRNFGQSAAFDAGFRHAEGGIIVTMDADRQNDPRDIPRMIEMLEKQGYDFVSGWRKNRKDAFLLRQTTSKIANWIIRRVTKTRIHDLGCSLKAYRREITDEIFLYGEMHRFLAPLAEGAGARVGELVVNHRARVAGESKYGLSRTGKVLLDLFTVWFMKSYHTKPIYIFGGTGFAMLATSVLTSAWVLYDKLWLDIRVHNNPLFILSMIFLLMGIHFIGLGLIAEIVVRVYFESQKKRAYLIATSPSDDTVAAYTP